jgi:hypothetical protein
MNYFRKSRYDILLGHDGVKIEIVSNHKIIYGPRGSGRTTYLLEDLVNQQDSIIFFSNFCRSNHRDYQRMMMMARKDPLDSRKILFISYSDLTMGGRSFQGLFGKTLYFDELDRVHLDHVQMLSPLVFRAERILITLSSPNLAPEILNTLYLNQLSWEYVELESRELV